MGSTTVRLFDSLDIAMHSTPAESHLTAEVPTVQGAHDWLRSLGAQVRPAGAKVAWSSRTLGAVVRRHPLLVAAFVAAGEGLVAPLIDGLRSSAEEQSTAAMSLSSLLASALLLFVLLPHGEALRALRGRGFRAAVRATFYAGSALLTAHAPQVSSPPRVAELIRAARGLVVAAVMGFVGVGVFTALTSAISLFTVDGPMTLAPLRLLFGLAAFAALLVLVAERIRAAAIVIRLDDWYEDETPAARQSSAPRPNGRDL